MNNLRLCLCFVLNFVRYIGEPISRFVRPSLRFINLSATYLSTIGLHNYTKFLLRQRRLKIRRSCRFVSNAWQNILYLVRTRRPAFCEPRLVDEPRVKRFWQTVNEIERQTRFTTKQYEVGCKTCRWCYCLRIINEDKAEVDVPNLLGLTTLIASDVQFMFSVWPSQCEQSSTCAYS